MGKFDRNFMENLEKFGVIMIIFRYNMYDYLEPKWGVFCFDWSLGFLLEG